MKNSLRSILGSASALAIALTKTDFVDFRGGKPGKPARGKRPGAIGRHLIRHEVAGPFFRQVGVRHLRDPNGKLHRTAIVTERFVTERILHATKGWRSRNRAIDRRLYWV